MWNTSSTKKTSVIVQVGNYTSIRRKKECRNMIEDNS